MACETYIDCTNKDISPEDMFRKLIRTTDDGCAGIAVQTFTKADESCETFVECDTKNLTWKDLFFKIVGIDDDGCAFIRIIE